jgi:hypothetical protein
VCVVVEHLLVGCFDVPPWYKLSFFSFFLFLFFLGSGEWGVVPSVHLKLDNCRGESWTVLPSFTVGCLIWALGNTFAYFIVMNLETV